jgi:hypothetical protein
MPSDNSLAKLYREYGDRWEIEQIPAGTKWIAVQRNSEGDITIVVANAVGTLRFRMTAVEREASEEPGQLCMTMTRR